MLVLGTDTGVGKTYVACALARHLVRRRQRVVAVKLVETGCEREDPEGEDGALLAAASGQAAPRLALARFAAPLAPPLAAELEGRPLDLAALMRQAIAAAAGEAAEVLLIEGAGGVLSPLTWAETALDVARQSGAPALLVAADRLGVVNHVRLTLLAMEQHAVACLGLVLSAPACPDRSTGENASALRRLFPELRIAVLARGAGETAAATELAEIAAWLPSLLAASPESTTGSLASCAESARRRPSTSPPPASGVRDGGGSCRLDAEQAVDLGS